LQMIRQKLILKVDRDNRMFSSGHQSLTNSSGKTIQMSGKIQLINTVKTKT
jgi:hypothetical protein